MIALARRTIRSLARWTLDAPCERAAPVFHPLGVVRLVTPAEQDACDQALGHSAARVAAKGEAWPR